MAVIKVKNQDEFEKALAKQSYDIELVAPGRYVIVAGDRIIAVGSNLDVTLETRGSSTGRLETRESSTGRLETRESSTGRLETWGSSTGRLVTRESSTGRLETWESSTGRLETRESSTGRLETWGSSTGRLVTRGSSTGRLETWGSSTVKGTAGKYAATINAGQHDKSKADIPDCIVLPNPDIKTAADWCDYYGARVEGGYALLFKAVRDDYRSGRGFLYALDTKPKAPDWDGGKQECGLGLHFCASPGAAGGFDPLATKYLGCWIKLKNIAIHPKGDYPHKVKSEGVDKPIFEVDIDGNPISTKEAK